MTGITAPTPLSKVRELSLTIVLAPSKWNICISEVTQLLLLPSLMTFRGCSVDATNASGSKASTDAKSPLRTIDLTKTHVSANGISELLKRCPNLETLSLLGRFDIPCDGLERFAALGSAINTWGKQLQHLTLKITQGTLALEAEPLGFLRNLRSLRKLVVPEVVLFGRAFIAFQNDSPLYRCSIKSLLDSLPPSLHELHVTTFHSEEGTFPFGHVLLELLADHRFSVLKNVSFKRYQWAKDFLRQSSWSASESTSTQIILKRPA